MKNKKIVSILLTSMLSFGILASINNTKDAKKVNADGWETVETKAYAVESQYVNAANDGFIFFKLSVNDYSFQGNVYEGLLPHTTTYNVSNYNLGDHVLFSNDDINYIPYSQITKEFPFFWNDGRYRLGISTNPSLYENANYTYIKVLAGAEFPSYNHIVNGGTPKKFVQKETTISKINQKASPTAELGAQYYSLQAAALSATGIVTEYGWNNDYYETSPGYRHVIINFGTFGTDYFTANHQPEPTNRATTAFEIGNNLTINGTPISKIHDIYPLTSVDYAHGNNFMHIQYPEVCTLHTNACLVSTIEVAKKTSFVEGAVEPFKLQLVGDKWYLSDYPTMKLSSDKLNMKQYRWEIDKFPYTFADSDPHDLFSGLPLAGGEMGFVLNLGNYSMTGDSVCNLAMYNNQIIVTFAPYANAILVQLGGKDPESLTFMFSKNVDYLIEMKIETGTSTHFVFAINHAVLFDMTKQVDTSTVALGEIWSINPEHTYTFDEYREINLYVPEISYGGPSTFDFNEGDQEYDFASITSALNLYPETIQTNLKFEYSEGAVTSGKYNAGNHILTITMEATGYEDITKEVAIIVHGLVSYASVKFGDNEPVQAEIGSLLTAPETPTKPSDENNDYVFDGWYFEGFKWNFETDIVYGDMVLEPKFTPTARHYVVTVEYEGLNKANESFSVNKNTVLPFAIFNEDGIESFKVYLGDDEITELTVTSDVSIKVVYKVLFVYHDSKEASCLEAGNVAYYSSDAYPGSYFADNEGLIVIDDIVLPKLGHDVEHLDEKAATCLYDGNVECYVCEHCGRHFSDAAATNELTNDEWILKKIPHDLTHHDKLDAKCTEDGNIEYWECSYEPGVYYTNKECTETTQNVVLTHAGHRHLNPTYTWNETATGYECVAKVKCENCDDVITETKVATKNVIREATCKKEGQISFSVTFVNNVFSAQTKLVSTPKNNNHKYVHVDADPIVGMIEYYYCEECNEYFVLKDDVYVEVQYEDLFKKSKKGCFGSVVGSSAIIVCLSLGSTILLSLRKKEEK